jgi:hypothetical protein
VSGWHDFYILAGTASATLVGLLFVGLLLVTVGDVTLGSDGDEG